MYHCQNIDNLLPVTNAVIYLLDKGNFVLDIFSENRTNTFCFMPKFFCYYNFAKTGYNITQYNHVLSCNVSNPQRLIIASTGEAIPAASTLYSVRSLLSLYQLFSFHKLLFSSEPDASIQQGKFVMYIFCMIYFACFVTQ